MIRPEYGFVRPDIFVREAIKFEFSKLLLSNTTSHLHVHFVTLVFYLKASIFNAS